MNTPGTVAGRSVAGFRLRVFIALSVLILVLTVAGIALIEQKLAAETERQVETAVTQQLAAVNHTREVRQAVLTSICDALARKPRIHAALEDDALDLLYGSAHQEMRQLIRELAQVEGEPSPPGAASLQARFYRFLDRHGRVIPPNTDDRAGTLSPANERRLELGEVPREASVGYLLDPRPEDRRPIEVFTVPIVSHATFQPIAALVVGFPFTTTGEPAGPGELLWAVEHEGEVELPFLAPAERARFAPTLARALADPNRPKVLTLEGRPYRLIVRELAQDSPFPPLREIFLASLATLEGQKRELRRQVLLGGLTVLAAGLLVVRLLSLRLARPVEALAVASDEEHAERVRVEAALDETSRELERTARFSADASHQLKTPISVLRAGLEEILQDSRLAPPLRGEVDDLIRQTHRLNTVIDDLLLLARLDAGHLHLEIGAHDLSQILDGLLDDFSTLPDPFGLTFETDGMGPLAVLGERRHLALILQNLLENARKYNRPGGRIEIVLDTIGDQARLRLGNTGEPIPATSQAHIFERFHRGAMGEQVPGYGLGLNLARDLARLHGGDLRLLSSEGDWTVFELELPLASVPQPSPEAPA